MGQKVNPHGLRVGVIKDWDSRWFAKDSDFGDLLVGELGDTEVVVFLYLIFNVGVAAADIGYKVGIENVIT